MPSIIDPFSQDSDTPQELERRRAAEFKLVMSVAAAWAVLASGAAYVIHKHIAPQSPRSLAARPTSVYAAAQPQRERVPVLFTNPFDPAEVFEFPPGTPETDAHQAVARLLLERAQERVFYLQPVRRVVTGTPSARG